MPSAKFKTSYILLPLLLALTACSDKTPNDPRFYGENPRPPQTIAQELPSSPAPSPRMNGFSMTDLLASTGGDIQVNLTQADGTTAAGGIRARYEEPRTRASSEQSAEFQGSIDVPIATLFAGEPLTLVALEVLTNQGAMLKNYVGDELAALRAKANKGVSVLLKLASTGQSLSDENIVRNAIPPIAASADLEYAPIPEAVSDESPQALMDRLRGVATATVHYHQDLFALVQNAPILTSERLAAILDSVYFNADAHTRLTRARAAIGVRRDRLGLLLAEIIQKNLNYATTFGEMSNRILAAGLPKVQDFNAETGMRLLHKAFPLPNAAVAFDYYFVRFIPLTANAREAWIALAKAKQQARSLVSVGAEWFHFDSNGTAQTLVNLIDSIPRGAALDLLIADAATRLRSATAAEAKLLIQALSAEDKIVQVVPKLIACVPGLTSSQYIELAQAIPLGPRRNQLIKDSVNSLGEITSSDALAILKAVTFLPIKIEIAGLLLAKVSDLNFDKLFAILSDGNLTNVRDGILVEAFTAISRDFRFTSAQFTQTLRLLTSRTTLALDLLEAALPHLSDLSTSNAMSIAQGVTRGPNRDGYARRLLEVLPDLTAQNLSVYASLGSTSAVQAALIRRGNTLLAASPATRIGSGTR